MKPKHLGKGDTPSLANSPIDLGLSSQEKYDASGTKLRSETGQASGQRAVGTDKTVKSDRGSFKSKC